jgi:hypothetical protein
MSSKKDYQYNQRQAVNDFDIIKPILNKIGFSGEFYLVEGDNHPLAKSLDTLSGIDTWYFHKSKWCRGMASRIQRDGKDWSSFTVRRATEFYKRSNAIKNNFLYPYYTMQAYIVDGIVSSLAIAKTKDVISYITKYKVPVKQNSDDGNEFYIVFWDDMVKAGFNIKIYKSKDNDE